LFWPRFDLLSLRDRAYFIRQNLFKQFHTLGGPEKSGPPSVKPDAVTLPVFQHPFLQTLQDFLFPFCCPVSPQVCVWIIAQFAFFPDVLFPSEHTIDGFHRSCIQKIPPSS